ncbi:MAG: TonB-dependent receptor [Acidobacteria bacterium]|nr:TonB-dependent receptor [Acidobacteriota bacterium]
MRIRSLFTALLLAIGLIAPQCYAQFETGTIVGKATDTTGAVIPGATVTVTNVATGVALTRTTDGNGDYQVPTLRVGKYRVQIAKAGFNTATAENVTIVIGTTQRVDLSLATGGSTESVTVMANDLTLETESSQKQTIITNEQIEAFPLPTLNYTDLVSLSTGVTPAPLGINDNGASLVRDASYNINGQRSMYNDYLLDGMDNNAHGVSNQGFSNQVISPSQNSVAQFSVVTNNQSAEYGRSSGGTINTAFKSGTNRIHGEVYEYLRNTVLNAVGYFASPTGKPTLIRNQFGMNIGGPIKRDKFFYFVDYEGFRQVRTRVARSNVFRLTDRQYIVSPTAVDSASTKVVDPFTGLTYAANQPLPPAILSPIAKAIVQSFPLPNTPGVPATTATDNYSSLQRFTDFLDKYDVRLDGQWNPRTSSFLRLSQSKEYANDGPTLPEPLDGASNGKQRIINQQVALGLTRQIGASDLLEARLGFSFTKGGKYTPAIGDPRTFGIPGTPTDPRICCGLVSQVLSGYTTFGRQATNPQWQYPSLLNPKITYSFPRGRHNLKVGYEFQHLRETIADTNPLFGRMTYAGSFSRYTLGDFFFGAPSKLELTTFLVVHVRANAQYAFIQDDWKILPKLTINAGVRYEYGGHFWEKDNNQTNFDPATTPTTLQMIKAKNGSLYEHTLIDPDLNNFMPRVGLAYSPSQKTVVHAAFGISYVHFTRNAEADVLAINGPQNVATVQNQVPAHSYNNQVPTGNFRTIDQGFPAGFIDPSTYDISRSQITYVPRNYRDPYVESWYVGVQQQLGKNRIVDISYVGNHSVKMQVVSNYNQANPALGRGADKKFKRPISTLQDISYTLNAGGGNYNGLQTRFEQRHFFGLTVLNSFTWSRTFDTASANLEYKWGHSPAPMDLYNPSKDYGPSENDRPLVNVLSVVWTLPVGKGKRFLGHANSFTDAVLGGWQLSAINTDRSGASISPTYSASANNQVSTLGAAYSGLLYYRPWVVPGTKPQRLHVPGRPDYAFCNNTLATSIGCTPFLTATLAPNSAAPAGYPDTPFGNAPNGMFRADPLHQLDLALNKTFKLPLEGVSAQFRGQFYNVLNKTNFQPPGTTCCGSSFGVITDTYGPGRIGQFALKILF